MDWSTTKMPAFESPQSYGESQEKAFRILMWRLIGSPVSYPTLNTTRTYLAATLKLGLVGTVGFGGFGNSLPAEDGVSASSPNAVQRHLVDICLASAAIRRWIDVSSEVDAHWGCCGAYGDSLALCIRSFCEEPWRSMGAWPGLSATSHHCCGYPILIPPADSGWVDEKSCMRRQSRRHHVHVASFTAG